MKQIKQLLNNITNYIGVFFTYAFYAIPVVKAGFHKDIEFTDPDNPWKK